MFAKEVLDESNIEDEIYIRNYIVKYLNRYMKLKHLRKHWNLWKK